MRGISRGRRPSCGSVVSNNSARNTAATSGEDTIVQIEANEKTPLLLESRPKRSQGGINDEGSSSSGTSTHSFEMEKSHFCDFRLIGIIFILMASLLVASYLLVTETRRPSMKFALDLVSRDIWSKAARSLGAHLNHSNVDSIMIAHTGGYSCMNYDACVDILKEMQAQGNSQAEVPFNFLVGDDGLTYEVRGWDHESGFQLIPQASSMVIGFIGNYTITDPSGVQLLSALSLIRESIRRAKLQRHYQIYGLRNLTVSHVDAEALFNCIAKWTGFKTLLHIV